MGAWQEIVDYTWTGNETSRAFTGLSITKDDFVKVLFTAVTTSASFYDFRLLGNSSVNSNYHHQLLFGSTSAGAVRENVNRLSRGGGNATLYSFSYLKLSENDRLNIFSNYNEGINATNMRIFFAYNTSSGATFTSGITSLTLEASLSNGIGTGSRIQIYKLAAEKVADITVATNTTQVDISSLSIDKDSEYLLVSDAKNATSTNANISLCVNKDTTLTNYHSQRLDGSGSSATTNRENSARFHFLLRNNFSPTPSHEVSYTHIKLSNIGTHTYQSYQIAGGTSSLSAFNTFGSSTAENITSITELNLVSSVASTIAAGSRFILYKLYE